MNENLPERIENEEQLEELLSRPTAAVVEVFRRLEGDLIILGAGGKVGPSLSRMVCRARELAGSRQRVTVVSRFSDQAARASLEQAGAQTISADLLDPAAVAALPPAAHVLYLIGQKFGTTDRPGLTWVVNTVVPAYVAQRYRSASILAFSSGNVYSLAPTTSAGSRETDPLEPMGEYPNACVGRERVFEHYALTQRTPMVFIRLSYAVEMRYGVLADIAAAVRDGHPVDLTTGCFSLIWQGDNNAFTLQLLEHAACPPLAVNLTGPHKYRVRDVAMRLGELMGKPARFTGTESGTAFFSDTSRLTRLFGPPQVELDTILRWTADWVLRGGRSLGKPTHFATRDGKY